MLDLVQQIVKDYSSPAVKQKMKTYDQCFKEHLEQAFNNEFSTSYFIRNERTHQIRRTMAIMTMRKTELKDNKIDYYL